MKISKIFIFMLLLLSMTSCAVWKTAESNYTNSKYGYSINLPQNWMRFQKESNPVTVSFDGPSLDKIEIGVYGSFLKFKNTKKQLEKDMLAEEIAELVEDDYKLNPSYSNYERISLEPYSSGKYDGFRLNFKNRERDGYKLQTIITGFWLKNNLYLISYTASEAYYYEQFVQKYEDAVNSFTIK